MRPRRETSGGPPSFARLSEVVRTITSGEMSEGASVAARERFLAAITRHRRRAGSGIAWSGGAGILAVGAAAAHLLQPTSTASEARAAVLGNGYVSGGPGPSRVVRLPGGPSVEFAPGSRGRVADLDEARAHVVLEGGRATVRGAAHAPNDVRIEAGPYAVTSRGACFDVSWSGDAIEVRVASGMVTVAGPVVSQGLTLHEDQSCAAREDEWELRCF